MNSVTFYSSFDQNFHPSACCVFLECSVIHRNLSYTPYSAFADICIKINTLLGFILLGFYLAPLKDSTP